MAARRQKTKKSKFLGRRHFGVGNAKNRRGSGNRGGRGNAGMCKHKNSWVTVYAPDYFGKHGFTRQGTNVSMRKMPIAHLYDIERKALLGKLDKKDGKFVYSFVGKILATGDIAHPVHITALCWSKNVEEKIKQAGGTITALEKKAKKEKVAKPAAKTPAKSAKAA